MTPREYELRKILRIYFASQTCKNGVAGECPHIHLSCSQLNPLLAIQIFMWLYMLSQFVQAPSSIRRSRAVYLGVSFILMSLAVSIAVIGSMDVFNTLFQAQPTNPEPSFEIWWSGYDALGYLGDLLGDVALFIADALLVSGTGGTPS
jgi:hypothetical protein